MNTEIPYGYCHCGCGELTGVAKSNNKAHKRGERLKFINGHNVTNKETRKTLCIKGHVRNEKALRKNGTCKICEQERTRIENKRKIKTITNVYVAQVMRSRVSDLHPQVIEAKRSIIRANRTVRAYLKGELK